MQTIRLIYASEAHPEYTSYASLTALLQRAVAHNTAHDVTGMLVYSSNKFLQVLEGNRDTVNALYNRIVKDRRHQRCTLLSAQAIERRDFADWAMRLVGAEDIPTAPRRVLLQRLASQSVFDPFLMTADQASRFLSALADAERRDAA